MQSFVASLLLLVVLYVACCRCSVSLFLFRISVNFLRQVFLSRARNYIFDQSAKKGLKPNRIRLKLCSFHSGIYLRGNRFAAKSATFRILKDFLIKATQRKNAHSSHYEWKRIHLRDRSQTDAIKMPLTNTPLTLGQVHVLAERMQMKWVL